MNAESSKKTKLYSGGKQDWNSEETGWGNGVKGQDKGTDGQRG